MGGTGKNCNTFSYEYLLSDGHCTHSSPLQQEGISKNFLLCTKFRMNKITSLHPNSSSIYSISAECLQQMSTQIERRSCFFCNFRHNSTVFFWVFFFFVCSFFVFFIQIVSRSLIFLKSKDLGINEIKCILGHALRMSCSLTSPTHCKFHGSHLSDGQNLE